MIWILSGTVLFIVIVLSGLLIALNKIWDDPHDIPEINERYYKN